MKNIQAHAGILEYLRTLPQKDQKRMISVASRPLVNCLSEICLNLIKQNIPLSPADISKLKKYEKEIRMLANRKVSLKRRKQVVTRGGVLSTLISILPSIIGGLISSLN